MRTWSDIANDESLWRAKCRGRSHASKLLYLMGALVVTGCVQAAPEPDTGRSSEAIIE
jgi:hypothetical protein